MRLKREQLNITGTLDVVESRARSKNTRRHILHMANVQLLTERLCTVEAALSTIMLAKPLTHAVSGRSSCRHFPKCSHPGCQELVVVKRRAREALAESRALTLEMFLRALASNDDDDAGSQA